MKRGRQRDLFDRCEVCGMLYADFKTGLTYQDIYDLRWREDADSSTWLYKRRHTILGSWREIKQALWAQHLNNCATGEPDAPLELEIVTDEDIEY